MNEFAILNSDTCRYLTQTLAHFLWQGFAITLLATFVTACLRKRSAQSRYLVHVATIC